MNLAVPASGSEVSAEPAPRVTSPLALWSLFLGFLSMLGFGFVLGIPAMFIGFVGRCRIGQEAGRWKGSGWALAGILMGLAGTVLSGLLFLLAVAMLTACIPGAGDLAYRLGGSMP